MEEEQTEEQTEEKETIDAISEADKVAERMENANKKKEELLVREERLKAQSGSTNAGFIQAKETEDEKWKREAKLRYAGTGMDPTE